ncbi:hypothetical protein, partial [Escherichia fergusonii]|uniref:hypothetical protein n=1 Tax=Escherichia fergusonii TaxID=564 RepID=UPI001CBE76C0
SGEKRVFLVILFTSFSGSLVSRISGAVHNSGRVREKVTVEAPGAVKPYSPWGNLASSSGMGQPLSAE